MKNAINYITGDVLSHDIKEQRIIAHICNNMGGWGKGFVTSISKRWSAPESDYRLWANGSTTTPFHLGQMRIVAVEENCWVANMLAQNGYKSIRNPIPVDYVALHKCLTTLAKTANTVKAAVHMPRIGCRLGGGNWESVELIIEQTLVKSGVRVFVYTPEQTN